MMQTRTILILAIAGLLLPIAIIALRQTDNLRHDAMDCAHITTHLESMDDVARLPESPTLVLGSTTARNWPDRIDQLGGRPVLVRAVDQLSAAAVANCFPRLAGHYRPGAIVLLLDSEDLGKLETELRRDVSRITDAIARLDANISLIISGLLRTPARDNNRVDLLNRAIADETRRRPGVAFADPNTRLSGPDGAPNPQRFWPNGNTLGDDSFDALADAIEDAILRQPSLGDRL